MQVVPSDAIRAWMTVGGTLAPKSISLVCPRCCTKAVFTMEHVCEDAPRLAVAASSTCPGCGHLVRFWAVRDSRTPSTKDNPPAVYMYPAARRHYPKPEFVPEVPEPLRRAFEAAVDALNSQNYVATTVCARRTLEGLFKTLAPGEQNASLARLIEVATEKVDLAAPLRTLSHAIRSGGNLGAHFDEEKEPDEALARQVVELLDYLFSYLFVLPTKIKRLEDSLGKDA